MPAPAAKLSSAQAGRKEIHSVQGTLTDFKNELLFEHFNINYNELPLRFRKVRCTPACFHYKTSTGWFE